MNRTRESSTVPIPDPTLLTTAALKLSIENLERFLVTKIESGDELLDEKIRNNFCLDEKRHRETREWISMLKAHRLEAKEDRDKAIAAAFEAQKELFNQSRICNEEAAGKAEASFTKQIEALAKETAVSRTALSDRIDALKEQSAQRAGKDIQSTEARGNSQWLIGLVIAIILSLIGNAITLIYLFTHTQ